MKKNSNTQMARLKSVVHVLRKKCPWDKKQTHQSLLPYLIEETFEAVDAIESKDKKKLKEELGDVLLQVVLHSELAKEKKDFDLEEVAKGISDKLVERHPHVYGDIKYKDEKSHLRRWNEQKHNKSNRKSILDGIPRHLPSLQYAHKQGSAVSAVGFDWPDNLSAFAKVKEEVSELQEEIQKKNSHARLEHELGDLLLAITNLARHLKIDSEGALRKANRRFAKRFNFIEKEVSKSKKDWSSYTLNELDTLWEKAKTHC